jgi:hypothetical protein
MNDRRSEPRFMCADLVTGGEPAISDGKAEPFLMGGRESTCSMLADAPGERKGNV